MKVIIRDCCGRPVETVDFEFPADAAERSGYAIRYEYEGDILRAAGLENYRCDGCGDRAYSTNPLDPDDPALTDEI